MFWSKKKEETGLPELPLLKPVIRSVESVETIPEEKNEFPELPDESSWTKEEGLPEVPEEELPELHASKMPKKLQSPRTREIDELEMPRERFSAEFKSTGKSEDVYIKIDRFHSARKSLAAAKTKLQEIEQLLSKIRETKMREEQELASWEKEIELIKTKVEDVTKNIFEKVE